MAESIGISRILRVSKYHYPLGAPDLPEEQEALWRRDALARALDLLGQRLSRPLVACDLMPGDLSEHVETSR